MEITHHGTPDRRGSPGKNAFPIRPDYLVCLFIVAATALTYWPIRNHEFINFDDDVYVYANQNVTTGLKIENMMWAFGFSKKEGLYWQPLTWLSHMMDCQLYGLNPGMHHSTNLVFHIASSILLFWVLKRMTGFVWESAFVAALFALHPINVESVAWISARKNVLSTFFWMATMMTYYYYVLRPGAGRYLLVLLVFSCGLLAKPMLVTLPFVFLLLDYWPLGRLGPSWTSSQPPAQRNQRAGATNRIFKCIAEKLPFFVLSLTSMYTATASLSHFGNLVATDTVSMMLRIENALVSYVGYLGKMFFPVNLAVYYPYPEKVPGWQVLGAVFVLAVVSMTVIWRLRQAPAFGIGWFWFLGTLVPVSGLVQAGVWPAMADRFAYVPLIGIFMMIAWGLSTLVKRGRVRKSILAVSAVVVLPCLMATTRGQLRYWENGVTLFEHALRTTRGSYTAHANLGNALARRGRLDEAIKHYSEALRIDPGKKAEVHNNLGAALIVKGRFKEALPYIHMALKENPSLSDAQKNLQIATEAIRQDRTIQP